MAPIGMLAFMLAGWNERCGGAGLEGIGVLAKAFLGDKALDSFRVHILEDLSKTEGEKSHFPCWDD